MTDHLIVVGPGRLGVSLAADVAASGEAMVTVVGRASDRPELLARTDGVDYLTGDGAVAVREAGEIGSSGDEVAVVYAVPDDQLEDAIQTSLAARTVAGGPINCLHTSGARPASVLAPLAEAIGAAVASWHPLIPIPLARRGAFAGGTVGIEGDPAAVAFGERLAGWVGARTLLVPAGSKARYHAAAVFASNYLVACLHAAATELAAVTDDPEGLAALLPLARAAVENVAELGTSEGASGPISRGDFDTIQAHLAALDPPHDALYRALGAELLRAVGPRLDPADERRIARLLEEGDA